MIMLSTITYGSSTLYDDVSTIATIEQDFYLQRTASLILGVVILSGGFYLLVSLSCYEHHVARKNKTIKGLNRKRAKFVVDRTSDWMRWLCLFASILLLTRLCLEFLEIFKGESSSRICEIVRKLKAVLQCLAFTCIYLVLWLRQRNLYRLPAMEYLSSRPIRFFSASFIFIMVFANILTIALYLFTRSYTNSLRGCVLNVSSVWSKLPGLLLFLFTCSFQIILLWLLLYPLYKHKTSSSFINHNKEINLFKRVTAAVVATVLSTGLVSLIAITALDDRYGALRQAVYNVDILISLISVICSFTDWRVRLFPFAVEDEKIVGTVKRVASPEDSSTNVTGDNTCMSYGRQ